MGRKPRKSQLVSQYLENVSRGLFDEYQDLIASHVKGREGIYALYRNRKLYYVGLARDLKFRMKQHLKDRHGSSWNRFSLFLTIGDHHLRELEALLIRVTRPSGNKQVAKFVKSENLKRQLKREMAARDRAKTESLLGLGERDAETKNNSSESRELGVRKASWKSLVGKVRKLRGKYKDKEFTAIITSKGIKAGGKIYASPSGAAMAVTGMYSVDGWHFWKFERAPGDWVPLDKARKSKSRRGK